MTPVPSLDALTGALDYPMYVVTVAGDGRRAGCLVGFATQCSIDPPWFLVCISKANHTFRVAEGASWLALHFLDAGQVALAERFGTQTGDRVDKFAGVAWHPGPGDTPLLDDCPNRVVGRITARMDAGDHMAFLLGPVDASAAGDYRPLTFQQVRHLEPGHGA